MGPFHWAVCNTWSEFLDWQTDEQEGQSMELLTMSDGCVWSSTSIILWFVHCGLITHPDLDLGARLFLITCEGRKSTLLSTPSLINIQENLIWARRNPHTHSHRGISFFNIHVTVQLSPLRLLSDDLAQTPVFAWTTDVSIARLFLCWRGKKIWAFANLAKEKEGYLSQGGTLTLVWVWTIQSHPDGQRSCYKPQGVVTGTSDYIVFINK